MTKVMRAFLAAGVIFVSGCGYTSGALLPTKFKTIYVVPVENKIDYMNQTDRKLEIPGLETRVRASIIDRYLFDGHLRIGEKETADLIVTAKLLSFDREELRLTSSEDVREYRLRITIALKIEDAVDHTVMCDESAFAGESTYYTSGPLAKSESDAIDAALKDLAMRVIERTTEDW